MMAENPQHPDLDTRDLAPVPRSDFEEAVALVRKQLERGITDGPHCAREGCRCDWAASSRQAALLALDIIAARGRALEILDGEFSLFTLKDKGKTIVAVQDENCERKLECRGDTLAEALRQAASTVAADRRAGELEAERG